MAKLIIGATGYIGSHIYASLKNQVNEQCIGTRCHSSGMELEKFDILNDDVKEIDKKIQGADKTALICTADGNIDYCYINKETAYEKNVLSTIRTIDKLNELGYHIIFLSTDHVFDGMKGKYTESDTLNPINLYGKMKCEVENYLTGNILNSCVLRLGKVIGNFSYKNDLLNEWYNKAVNKEKIFCIRGNKMNLIHADDIAEVFSIISKNKFKGVYHIAGAENGLRKDLCQRFIDNMKLKCEIVELDVEKFPFQDKRPLDITMSSDKFINQTGYQFLDMENITKKYEEYIRVSNRNRQVSCD